MIADVKQAISLMEMEKAYYAEIEERLETHCEKKLLFLNPALTCEMLCLRLGIAHKDLNRYFCHYQLTFNHYINSLRVEHAMILMQDCPNLTLSEVAQQSGFLSLPAFRKAFKTIMGFQLSDIKKGQGISLFYRVQNVSS